MAKTKNQGPSKFVVKSNDLIEARYRLSLQESHVVLWLLTQIGLEDEEFKTHRLKVKDFAEMVGLRVDGQYDELKKITENLMRRVMKIREPARKTLLQVAWLSSALYEEDKGIVSLSFDPALKPYLLQLKSQFTKISIADTLKFKSIYAVRIYELLSQYAPIGKREISIEDLRAYCGIEEKEYALYGDLKRKVINRAKEEINTKTDYDVDYQEKKESRKVASLDWTIKKIQAESTTRVSSKQTDSETPLDYESCPVFEIVDFCQRNKSSFPRPLSDYLLNVKTFNLIENRLTIGVDNPWQHKCLEETPGAKERIMEYFGVDNVEFVLR